jgi:tRNA pseudouridine38-40 synthase
VKKTYRFWIWNNQRATALLARYSWWIRQPMDVDFLNACAKHLISEQDFASFKSEGTTVKHTIRHIYQARWRRKKSGLLEFEVTGNGFMKQMVRNIVGTQIDLAIRDPRSERMLSILQAKDRTQALSAAPPQGLFLAQVYYPKELDNRCRQI